MGAMNAGTVVALLKVCWHLLTRNNPLPTASAMAVGMALGAFYLVPDKDARCSCIT